MSRTISKIVAVGACALALAIAPVAHASHSEEGTYTIGTTPGVGIVCSPDCLGPDTINLGGYQFDGVIGEIPASVTVADSSGGDVLFITAQDLDNDGLFGEAGEPAKVACDTTMTLATGSPAPFQAARDTLVVVRLADPGCLGGLGLGGTITLTWGAPA